MFKLRVRDVLLGNPVTQTASIPRIFITDIFWRSDSEKHDIHIYTCAILVSDVFN